MTGGAGFVLAPGLRFVLISAQILQGLSVTLLPPVAPTLAQFLAAHGAGQGAAQYIVTAPFLGLLVGSVASGLVIRWMGSRPSLIFAALVSAVASSLALSTSASVVLFGACALLGCGAAWLNSGLSGLTKLLVADAEQPRIIGLQSAAGNLTGMILGLITAFAAEVLGWRTPFLTFLAVSIGLLLLIFWSLPRIDARSDAQPVRFGRLLERIWAPSLAGMAALGIATCQSTVLPFLLEQHGLDTSGLRSLVMTATTGSAVIGSLFYGYAQRRLGTEWFVVAAGLFGAAGWLVFGLWAGGLGLAILGAALLGLAAGTALPILFMQVLRTAPEGTSGQAIGLLNAAMFIGAFANPLLIVGPLRPLGPNGIMGSMAVASLIIMGIATWFTRRPARR